MNDSTSFFNGNSFKYIDVQRLRNSESQSVAYGGVKQAIYQTRDNHSPV